MQRDKLLIEADELTAMIGNPDLRLFDATVLMQSDNDSMSEWLTEKLPTTQGAEPGSIKKD